MYFVYVLKSINHNWLYVGITHDLSLRLDLHNQGQVKSTKARLPYLLIYTEKLNSMKEARIREKYFKNNAGKEYLKRRSII
jgi:putative endonuclease